jgi:hypothetical protein
MLREASLIEIWFCHAQWDKSWDILAQGLIGLIGFHINKVYLFFRSLPKKNSRLSVFDLDQFEDVWPIGKLILVRTSKDKVPKKTSVDMCGQSRYPKRAARHKGPDHRWVAVVLQKHHVSGYWSPRMSTHARAWPVKAWPLPATAGTAGPLAC